MTQVMEMPTEAKSKTKVFNELFVTEDYGMLSFMEGNREVNDAHKHRLILSMREKYLISPLAVNEKMQIIDGQHRYEAAKHLNLPIYYYIVEGYGWDEVHRMNSNMKNWGKQEYLKSYCDMGYSEYIKFQDFWEQYPEFTLSGIEVILTNSSRTNPLSKDIKYKKQTGKDSSTHAKVFQEGNFYIPDLPKSHDNALKILKLRKQIDFFNQTLFVRTMISLFKNPDYNHDVLLQKLDYIPMVKQQYIKDFKAEIERIYNYKNRQPANLRIY